MIIGVTGHVNSGKTSFILRYAMSFGREGIVVAINEAAQVDVLPQSASFKWKWLESDANLPLLLDRINRESNIFRADRRVVVLKSVSRYLSGCHDFLVQEGAPVSTYTKRMNEYSKQFLSAVKSFQGQLFIISDEPASLTPFMSEQERCYHMELASINRTLAEWSHQWVYLSAGKIIEFRRNSNY